MRAASVAFLIGILLCVRLPALPDALFAGYLPILAFFAVFSSRPIRILAWVGMGFVWALFRAGMGIADILPPPLEGQDMTVRGIVASIPKSTGRKTSFLLDVLEDGEMRGTPRSSDIPRAGSGAGWGRGQRIRLNWYANAPRLLPGQEWRLTVRLKRPRGFRNPGGFDYEKWLFQKGIRATGYVRSASENQKVAEDEGPWLHRVRYRLARSIRVALGAPPPPEETSEGRQSAFRPSPYTGIAEALAIGVRNGITRIQWATLQSTGTTHLMAISGLHIGLVATLMFFAARRLWTLFPRLTLMVPAQRLAAPVALAGALGYAALAGFSLPTQRALVMVSVVMIALFRQRHVSPDLSLAAALLAVLLLDPFSVLSIGFWLSFAAVAIILFGMMGRPAQRRPWWRLGRVQILIAIGLIPLTVLFFQQYPLISPVSNLLAVPWIGFVVVPFVLAGTCLVIPFPDLGALLLGGGEWAISVLWPILEGLASLDFVYRKPFAPPLWTVLAGGVGVFLLLLPRGAPGRWLGVIWLLPLFLLPVPRPAAGEVWFTLLDVGQGLAGAVRTREHVLLYDLGPSYGPGFDAGNAVVVPFLRSQGIVSVDRIVLSHGDSDHAGGLANLLAEFTPGMIFTNTAENIAARVPAAVDGTVCRDGTEWVWDGVHFRFLHPASDEEASGNDGSCVLAITNTGGTILLTGDIGRAVEARLVEKYGEALRADVLVVPHHGSDTSSSDIFLAATRPHYALFSAGYRNRFGLPSPSVVTRYERFGARMLFSDRHGAIGFRLVPGQGISAPRLYRERARYFWHDSAVP